jgi:hypothetical protein
LSSAAESNKATAAIAREIHTPVLIFITALLSNLGP